MEEVKEEKPKKKLGGAYSKRKGNNFELKIIKELALFGYDKLKSSRSESKNLDNDKIDKIVMFVNPVAERNSCKFGFLPGTLLEKILGSQIGNFLASKLGSIEMVYNLIEQGKIEFIATADARGYEALNTRCAIYMTEAQNTTIDMMKLFFVLSQIRVS